MKTKLAHFNYRLLWILAPFGAAAALVQGCLGKTDIWVGDFPPEALVITPEEYQKLTDQDSIRDVTHDEYYARPIASRKVIPPGLVLESSNLFSSKKAPVVRAASLEAYAARAAKVYGTTQNQGALYKTLYDRLSPAERAGLAAPDSLSASGTLSDLVKANAGLVKMAARKNVFSAPAQRNSPKLSSAFSQDCTGDEDYSSTIKQDVSSPFYYSNPSVKGLMANFDFPLKKKVTCVKDQGGRGTCMGFAMTAALETEIAYNLGRFVNLSEQDFYSHAKNIWEVDEFEDGLFSTDTWGVRAPGVYFEPKEAIWAYNPSLSRVGEVSNDKGPFADSCDGYPPASLDCSKKSGSEAALCQEYRDRYSKNCSDTTHQARLKCSGSVKDWQGNTYRKCGFAGPYRTGDAFAVDGEAETWDANNPEASLDMMIALLRAGKPLVIGVYAVPSLHVPNAYGYLKYQTGETSLDGHALLVVGYISNEEVAASAGLAPFLQDKKDKSVAPAAGRGYFIFKNSWGPSYGDAGYGYMPTEWFKSYGKTASMLTGNVSLE